MDSREAQRKPQAVIIASQSFQRSESGMEVRERDRSDITEEVAPKGSTTVGWEGNDEALKYKKTNEQNSEDSLFKSLCVRN